MSKNCEHSWNYEHAVYSGDMIRRWCSECGLIQHAKAKNWTNSNIGTGKMWGEYPDGYPEEFRKQEIENGECIIND